MEQYKPTKEELNKLNDIKFSIHANKRGLERISLIYITLHSNFNIYTPTKIEIINLQNIKFTKEILEQNYSFSKIRHEILNNKNKVFYQSKDNVFMVTNKCKLMLSKDFKIVVKIIFEEKDNTYLDIERLNFFRKILTSFKNEFYKKEDKIICKTNLFKIILTNNFSCIITIISTDEEQTLINKHKSIKINKLDKGTKKQRIIKKYC